MIAVPFVINSDPFRIISQQIKTYVQESFIAGSL